MKKRVYLDYAAATPIRKEVLEAMEPWVHENFANPSALYKEAREARAALEAARETIGALANRKASDVIFAASSTEANNLAIRGYARAAEKTGRIVTLPIEHPSILDPALSCRENGWDIRLVPVDAEGQYKRDKMEQETSESEGLVTLAWANPDIGTVQPIRDIHQITKTSGAYALHIDASQAAGFLPLGALGQVADAFTLSSGKIYGSRGVAAFVRRGGFKLAPLIYGGGQEHGLRAGTESVALAVGFARALSLAEKEREEMTEKLRKLRNFLIGEVLACEGVLLTGPTPESTTERLPNHASFVFKDLDGEELAVRLDAEGYAVGTGTACATEKMEISRAVVALGIPHEYERGSVRVTIGRDTGKEDLISFIEALQMVLEILRTQK